MIWLSKMHEQGHVSYYFSPRSVNFSCSGGVSRGIIEGVFGDGTDEVLTEILLGDEESVCFLPVWNECDGAESFPQPEDDRVLGSLLLDEIKQRIDLDTVLLNGECHPNREFSSPQQPSPVRAMAA